MSAEPFAAHAALTETIDAASNALDAMERGWRCTDNEEYQEAERHYSELYNQRMPFDEAIAAAPISETSQLRSAVEAVTRTIELAPECGAERLRRLAVNISQFADLWDRREKSLAA